MVVHHQFVPAAYYGLFHTVKNLNCRVILSQCQEFSSCAKGHEKTSKKSITALHVCRGVAKNSQLQTCHQGPVSGDVFEPVSLSVMTPIAQQQHKHKEFLFVVK